MGGVRGRPMKDRSEEEVAELRAAAKALEVAIEGMAGNGLSPQEISLLTRIKPDRLYRKYRGAMMRGGAQRKQDVAQAAYWMAVGGPEKDWRRADASVNKFWLERQGGAGWRAPKGDEGDGPDLTRLSVAELIALERALRPLARNPVLIDGTIERVAESRGGRERADAEGAGDQPAGGVGERIDG